MNLGKLQNFKFKDFYENDQPCVGFSHLGGYGRYC
jgi:hypothetical protein